MKCKYCHEEINLTIYGLPDDICWGCADKETRFDALEVNTNNSEKPDWLKNIYSKPHVNID